MMRKPSVNAIPGVGKANERVYSEHVQLVSLPIKVAGDLTPSHTRVGIRRCKPSAQKG